MQYVLPSGWARIALKSGGAQAEAFGAFDWHVAFHTTSVESANSSSLKTVKTIGGRTQTGSYLNAPGGRCKI